MAHGLVAGSFALTTTPLSMRRLASPWYCVGACVRNVSLFLSVPEISLPVMTTFETWPDSTCVMKVLKLMA